ncbi:MAG: hypothetical protein ACTSQ8_21070 [Candidatus Helarchaeota archaeon]
MTYLEIGLTIISIVGFIGALPQIWGSDWGNIFDYYLRGKISWDKVSKAYLNVARTAKDQNFIPTVIIGVGRGGIVAAGLLGSEFIKITKGIYSNSKKPQIPKIKIGVINSTIYFKDNQDVLPESGLTSFIESIKYEDPEVALIPEDKILLIVAQNYSGQTLRDSKNLVFDKGIPKENIRTATLFCYKHPVINVKYHPDIIGMNTRISKTVPWKNPKMNTDRY